MRNCLRRTLGKPGRSDVPKLRFRKQALATLNAPESSELAEVCRLNSNGLRFLRAIPLFRRLGAVERTPFPS